MEGEASHARHSPLLDGSRAAELSCFRFGGCELDVATRSLVRDGAPVKLEPKVFDLLVFLLEHRDRVVTSNELVDAVWGGVAVTPSSLSRAVHKARRAVGDDGEKQEVIATLHGRGFRLATPVRCEIRARLASAESSERDFDLGPLAAAIHRVLQGSGGFVHAAGAPALRRVSGRGRRLDRVSSPSRSGPATAR